jgi:hypothetical protein
MAGQRSTMKSPSQLAAPLFREYRMIDTAAKGLGCYCKDPGESDTLREHVMLTKFAGFFAQNRFLKERSYPQVEYLQVIWSEDWKEARGIASKLSNEYLATRGILTTQEELEQPAPC